MQEHQLRVIEEATELRIKLNALTKFIHTHSQFQLLALEDQLLLLDQAVVMCDYGEILEKRIARF